ncbi:MAG TPA: lysine biosynthesis protein LysX [Herpetosiphonaceae bacterium]
MPGPRDTPLAVLTSRVRIEEKRIFEALERRNIPYHHLDERDLSLALVDEPVSWTAVINRCMSNTRSRYAAQLFEAYGVRVLNSSQVIATCGDKLLTSLALVKAGVPTPYTMVALSPAAALAALDRIGYPAVLKPVSGSWGRLLAKVNDRDAAEAILEHKQILGSPQHSVIYIQEYIDKPGRDIRVIVIGERVLCAMYRQAEHWITNTARGATTRPCEITDELAELVLRAAAAVGGGALAIDVLEHADGRLLVNEINHTMEFHGMMSATDVDVADALVQYALEVTGL